MVHCVVDPKLSSLILQACGCGQVLVLHVCGTCTHTTSLSVRTRQEARAIHHHLVLRGMRHNQAFLEEVDRANLGEGEPGNYPFPRDFLDPHWSGVVQPVRRPARGMAPKPRGFGGLLPLPVRLAFQAAKGAPPEA